eukprot:jgi/Chlat1/5979/Chrsp4S06187
MAEVSSFLLAMGIDAAICAGLLGAFTFLRQMPVLAPVFVSRKSSAEARAEIARARGVRAFSWIESSLRPPEAALILDVGLDALVYLRLFRLALILFAGCAVMCLPLLLPLNLTGGNLGDVVVIADLPHTRLDMLTMANIRRKSKRLWFHAAAAWWVSVWCYFVLFQAYKEYQRLREVHMASEETCAEQHTVLSAWERELERERRQASKTHKRGGTTTQQQQAGDTLGHTHARTPLLYPHHQRGHDARRPTHRVGFLGLWGPRLDSVAFYSAQLQVLEEQIQAESTRGVMAERTPSAVVVFRTRASATIARQDVNWARLRLGSTELTVRRALVAAAMFFLVVFFFVPVGIISGLAQIRYLQRLPVIKRLVAVPFIRALLEGFLPSVALLLVLSMMPPLTLALSSMQGPISKSRMHRAAVSKFFLILVCNVFLGYTIGGTLWGQLQAILDHPRRAVEILGASVPSTATFFLTFVATRALLSFPFELLRPWALIMALVDMAQGALKGRRRMPAYKEEVPYHQEVPNHLNVIVLGLTYAVIAPVLLVAALLYFSLGSLVWHHQAGVLNVYERTYESGGKLWPLVHNRVLAGLLIAQLTLIGVFGLKAASHQVLILLPLPFMTLAYYLWSNSRFMKPCKYLSLDTARWVDSLEWLSQDEDAALESVLEQYLPPAMRGTALASLPARAGAAADNNNNGENNDNNNSNNGGNTAGVGLTRTARELGSGWSSSGSGLTWV